jgi:cytochrome c5
LPSRPLSLIPLASALLTAGAIFSTSTALAMASADAPRTGEQVVQSQCVLCHGPGLGGAPKIGDGRAWTQRAHAGIDTLVRSALKGRGAMPPSGGVAGLTEPELRAAIAYMLHRSGVDVRE